MKKIFILLLALTMQFGYVTPIKAEVAHVVEIVVKQKRQNADGTYEEYYLKQIYKDGKLVSETEVKLKSSQEDQDKPADSSLRFA
ncbi:hypothetical protein [Prevotella corporis]|uniref:hypothetical protein n=1 Tax=Prevotella corporis TaxID=28128 RepID=UPI0023664BA0|nr:hypothetical protein [Prevotella corporis]